MTTREQRPRGRRRPSLDAAFERRSSWRAISLALVIALLGALAFQLGFVGAEPWKPLIARQSEAFGRARITRRDWERLPDGGLRGIPGLADPAPILDNQSPDSLLSAILIPRPPDTENSRLVREKILSVFRTQLAADKAKGRSGWHIDTPIFVADTPQGKKRMTNIILTKDIEAPRKLVLAAHYDSKWFSKASGMSGFVGATDSAAPCAMLVDIAIALDKLLDQREAQVQKLIKEGKEPRDRIDDTTLQIILLDGEEAYGAWSHTDSIYGARSLVGNWTRSYHEPPPARRDLERRRFKTFTQPVRRIDAIEHFVLLDLLGAREPVIPNYFPGTAWLHRELAELENRMRSLGIMSPDKKNIGGTFMSEVPAWGGIEDDHLPFLHNGVPILHLIPSPFPEVWHRLADDGHALDYPTMRAWAFLLRAFVAEYLGLEVPSASAQPRGHSELQ